MFGSHKVKIDGELLERVQLCVKAGGYESVDEFVVQVLEKELKNLVRLGEGEAPSRELVKKRLRGLGYIE
jgi:hypothetical protein